MRGLALPCQDLVDEAEILEAVDPWHKKQHVHPGVLRGAERVRHARRDQQEVTFAGGYHLFAKEDVQATADDEEDLPCAAA